MSRTKIDWSKHVITESFSENAKIWSIEQPNTCVYAVHFINAKGVMSVTGDLGNWIFCRPFHPSKDGYVSDGYWCEKLRISSHQNHNDYNQYKTDKDIRERAIEYLHELDLDIENDAEIEDEVDNLLKCGSLFNEEWQNFNQRYHNEISNNDKSYLEWLQGCYKRTHEGEHYYLHYAHDNLPPYCDHEDVIIHYDINHQLQIIFDAFDEICRRMREEK